MVSSENVKPSHPRFCAIVPAAGIGSRMGKASKKPYLPLAGEPLLFHTLRRLMQARGCAEIVLVLHPDEFGGPRAEWRQRLERQFGVGKLARGGATRQDSVRAGLQLVDPVLDIVLIHDAARPLVDPAVVEKVALEAAATGAALAAIPATATVKEVEADGRIRRTLPRDASEDGFQGTDDAQLVERLGTPVSVVPDSPDNLKITTPRDLAVAEALLKASS